MLGPSLDVNDQVTSCDSMQSCDDVDFYLLPCMSLTLQHKYL